MYNVLIVDDDTLMRNALRAMISRFKNFQIIGEAANGAEAIAICRLYPVHLIFMDIIMPGMTGIEAGKKIKYASSLPTPTFILPKKQWNYISKNTFPSQYLFLI